jgi:signal transduction histidine kinase
LDIVWSNLLSNAVKFTDEGGRVEVKLKKEGEKAIVSVTDTGCGISAESGARIFEKFYQADTSHAGEGNGLGLALVKKVIDVLGGTLSVSSEVGKGSTFTVALKGVE